MVSGGRKNQKGRSSEEIKGGCCSSSASISTSAKTHVVVHSWALSDGHDHVHGETGGDEADNMYRGFPPLVFVLALR